MGLLISDNSRRDNRKESDAEVEEESSNQFEYNTSRI